MVTDVTQLQDVTISQLFDPQCTSRDALGAWRLAVSGALGQASRGRSRGRQFPRETAGLWVRKAQR